MNELQVTAQPGTPFIDTERVVEAPRELVFRAFTEPELVAQWLGPRKYRMDVAEYDARHGGSWRYTHSDDEATYGFRGVFHGEPSVDAGITQTFEFDGWPGHVALEHVDFVDLGDGRTLIRNHSVYQTVEDRDGMVQSGMESGMSEGYERLDELMQRLATPAGAGR